MIYRKLLTEKEADRIHFMAIDKETLTDILTDELRELFMKDFEVRFLVFDKDEGNIVLWQS